MECLKTDKTKMNKLFFYLNNVIFCNNFKTQILPPQKIKNSQTKNQSDLISMYETETLH